jgi:hypothetical protein
VLLAALLTAPEAMAQRASAFDYIKAADIASGRIERSAVYDEVTFESEPLREAKMCDLNRGRIERLIAVLKRARASKEMRDGLSADMVLRFVRPGQTDLVAVISSPEHAGMDTEIFFGGRLALLDPAGLAAVHDVAGEAGCGVGLKGD